MLARVFLITFNNYSNSDIFYLLITVDNINADYEL